MKSDVLTYGPGLALPRSGRNRAAVKTKRGALARVCWQPYVYLLPALVLMCVWIYYPLLRTFYLSFFNWNMLPTTTPQFCGLDNFAKLLRTPGFSNAVVNTLVMMVGLLPFSIVLPVLVSIFAKSITKRASAFYRGMIFVPMILAPVAAAAVFRWILHPAGGLLNQLLERMGVEESISFVTFEQLIEEDEDGESVNRIYNNEADDTYEYYSDYYWVGAKDGVKMLYVITYAVEIEAQNDAAQQ